jgi:hypothetical protein
MPRIAGGWVVFPSASLGSRPGTSQVNLPMPGHDAAASFGSHVDDRARVRIDYPDRSFSSNEHGLLRFGLARSR